MLNDLIAKEPEILEQRSGQRKGSVGRVPQMEDYLYISTFLRATSPSNSSNVLGL